MRQKEAVLWEVGFLLLLSSVPGCFILFIVTDPIHEVKCRQVLPCSFYFLWQAASSLTEQWATSNCSWHFASRGHYTTIKQSCSPWAPKATLSTWPLRTHSHFRCNCLWIFFPPTPIPHPIDVIFFWLRDSHISKKVAGIKQLCGSCCCSAMMAQMKRPLFGSVCFFVCFWSTLFSWAMDDLNESHSNGHIYWITMRWHMLSDFSGFCPN